MRLIDSNAERLAKYLLTETAKILSDWDTYRRNTEPDHVEVYCLLGWQDVTRALAAAQSVERDLRRGARSYRDSYGSHRPTTIRIGAPELLLERLADYPQPLHTNQAGLDVVEVSGPRLALRLQPTEDVRDAVIQAGASLAGYAMASFGKEFFIDRIEGTNLRPVDLSLASVVEFVERSRPPFDLVRAHGHRANDLNRAYFQSVSSPPPEKRIGYEVHLIVQQIWGSKTELIHAWF